MLQLRAPCNVVGVDELSLLRTVFPGGREVLACEFTLGMVHIHLWGLLPLDDMSEKRRGENEVPGLYRVAFDFLPPSGHKLAAVRCRYVRRGTGTGQEGHLMIFELGGFGPLKLEAICNVPKTGEARTVGYIKAELGIDDDWHLDPKRSRE